jgi:hypothetical protein
MPITVNEARSIIAAAEGPVQQQARKEMTKEERIDIAIEAVMGVADAAGMSLLTTELCNEAMTLVFGREYTSQTYSPLYNALYGGRIRGNKVDGHYYVEPDVLRDYMRKYERRASGKGKTPEEVR